MSAKNITLLTIKISGVVLFVIVASDLPEYFKLYLKDRVSGGIDEFFTYFLPLIIPATFALLLFLYPKKVTDFIFTIPNELGTSGSEIEKIEVTLIKLLGLLLLFYSVSDLVFHITNLFLLKREFVSDTPIDIYNYSYLTATIAEFVFALWLLAGTKNVILFLKKLRRE